MLATLHAAFTELFVLCCG